MKITLDSLLVLDAIDRRGSFAAAAQELHRVPSAVTYTIHKLEQDLGVALFDRSGHRAVLTDPGRELLDEGRDLLTAAHRLESHVQHIASGWEAQLRIAVGDLVYLPRFHRLVAEFLEDYHDTRLTLSVEVFGGCWDALLSDRSDLVIGAPAGAPSGGGFVTQPLAEVGFVFAVAPDHPLATAPEPLPARVIQRHRAVTAADSSRNLPPRTIGILTGQETLTVSDMQQKRQAQIDGLGVGFLPAYLIASDTAKGRLVIKEVEERRESVQALVAWRSDHKGQALEWFRTRLADEAMSRALFAPI